MHVPKLSQTGKKRIGAKKCPRDSPTLSTPHALIPEESTATTEISLLVELH